LNIKSNILKIIGIITAILLSFLFFKILIYITISFVVFLIGYPLKQKLNIVRLFGKKLPNSISSFITLCLIFSVFLGVFFLIIPPLIKEITFLSELKFYDGYSWIPISSSLLIYDGGEPTTYKWENNPNGGDYSATFFVGIYDGGGP
jgi:predicted PurR-regulated permease PerM